MNPFVQQKGIRCLAKIERKIKISRFSGSTAKSGFIIIKWITPDR